MARKQHFPPEADTKPDGQRAGARPSGPAPKGRSETTEAPTLPPPSRMAADKAKKAPRPARTRTEPRMAAARVEKVERPGDDPRRSGMRARRGDRPSAPAATVDEVVADLSKDPRRDNDDEG